MDVRNRLAANLRRLRTAERLSQEEFANAHEFDRTYISGIERAVRNPTILVVERLANALGVDVAEMLVEPSSERR
jgi:transcriptional regulator with XRE-family HTH domain